MAKQEFLQLAHKYDPAKTKVHIGGWLLSEKLDGIRCFWDGGVSKGIAKSDVPWANTAKDGRYVDQQYSTGLWSRYGNVIHAPISWLNRLPRIPMDGELYMGRGEGTRQRLSKVVKKIPPNVCADDWEDVRYHVFEGVNLYRVLIDRTLDSIHFKKKLKGCYDWAMRQAADDDRFYQVKSLCRYAQAHKAVQLRLDESNDVVKLITNTKLSLNNREARNELSIIFNQLTAEGAEGIVVRKPDAMWESERSHNLLKWKLVNDMEGTVVGFVSGKETDKGSKLLGMIGSLIVKMDDGKIFNLSGLTDTERELKPALRRPAAEHPGEVIPSDDPAVHFKIGQRICFKYREMTEDGYPQEARYDRKRSGRID